MYLTKYTINYTVLQLENTRVVTHAYSNDDARDRCYHGDLFYKMAAEWLLYSLYLYSTVLPRVLKSKFYNIIAQLFSMHMLVFP